MAEQVLQRYYRVSIPRAGAELEFVPGQDLQPMHYLRCWDLPPMLACLLCTALPGTPAAPMLPAYAELTAGCKLACSRQLLVGLHLSLNNVMATCSKHAWLGPNMLLTLRTGCNPFHGGTWR